MHLLVHSTGLKLCGSGEWLLEKRKRKLTPTFRLGFDLARLRVVVGEAVCDGWDRELVRGVIRRS